MLLFPARGGSKGIPNKNIIDFLGKPLIHYTIEAALNSSCIDSILVSSDNQEIIKKSLKYKNVFIDHRPESLATDESHIIDTILRIIKSYPKYDEIILLQPTSPLRNSEDIDSIKTFKSQKQLQSVVSICKCNTPPELIYKINKKTNLRTIFKM